MKAGVIMFELSKEDVTKTLNNYEKILDRIREVVCEIGFLTNEYDTLEIEKTEFTEKEVYVVAYDSHYDMYDATGGSFPIEFLFEDADKHKDWYKKKKEERKRQYEILKQQRQKERDLAELQRLKEKYE